MTRWESKRVYPASFIGITIWDTLTIPQDMNGSSERTASAVNRTHLFNSLAVVPHVTMRWSILAKRLVEPSMYFWVGIS